MSTAYRVRLDSESIEWLEYDPHTLVLDVGFREAGRYRYLDVPAQVVLDLLQAKSAGTWFNQHFKTLGFEYLRLD